MKIYHTKNNIKEIGKDIKGIVYSSVSLIKDTLSVPLSICKDVRDGFLESKKKKGTEANKPKVELNTEKSTDRVQNPTENSGVAPA